MPVDGATRSRGRGAALAEAMAAAVAEATDLSDGSSTAKAAQSAALKARPWALAAAALRAFVTQDEAALSALCCDSAAEAERLVATATPPVQARQTLCSIATHDAQFMQRMSAPPNWDKLVRGLRRWTMGRRGPATPSSPGSMDVANARPREGAGAGLSWPGPGGEGSFPNRFTFAVHLIHF